MKNQIEMIEIIGIFAAIFSMGLTTYLMTNKKIIESNFPQISDTHFGNNNQSFLTPSNINKEGFYE